MSDLTIEEIRYIITGRALDHIRETDRTIRDGRNIVFQTFPGSGKTTSVMMAIDRAGYTWIYLAPFHDIIKENLHYSTVRDYNFIHLKGREQPGMCLAPEYQKYAKELKISIVPFCETRCHFKESGCPYYETVREIRSYPQHWAGVHAHVPTFLQSFFFQTKFDRKLMFNYFDVIILDEFPFQVLFNQIRITRKDIDNMRNVLALMEFDTPEYYIFSRFLDQLTLSTDVIGINYRAVKGILQEDRSLDFKTFIEIYDGNLLNLVKYDKIKDPPKKILYNFALLYEQNPPLQQLEWMLYRHKWDGWQSGGIYITTSNIKYFQTLPVPIIALDATADRKAWKNLLKDDECNFERIDIEYKNIFQMKSYARYPVSTWITIEDKKKVITDSGKRLCNLIGDICRRKDTDVLICSNKRIRNLINPYLEENDLKNYKNAIYYNLRSRNDFYEDCDTCIVTHEPNIPPLQLDIMHNVIKWDYDLLSELLTKNEMLQAIGRARQNIDETPYGRKRGTIEIYIIPGAIRDEDKLLPECKLIPYRNMRIGSLKSLADMLKELIEKSNRVFSFKELRSLTKDLCSERILKSELGKLELQGFISSSKRKIEWIWDEDEFKRTKYKRL